MSQKYQSKHWEHMKVSGFSCVFMMLTEMSTYGTEVIVLKL